MKSPVALILVLGCLSVRSEAEQNMEPGERIRIRTTAGERLTGRVADMGSDSVVIELEDESGSRSLARSDLESLETRRARSRSSGAWHKAKWGALIGAVSGTTLGFQHEQVGEDGATVGEAVALGVWSGFVMGGLIGAAVGALSPGEEWVKVAASVGEGRDPGFSLSVTFEF